MTLTHQPLRDFIDSIAADQPAPGAGAAAAVALAMGAACAAKALRISARHSDDPALAAAADRALDLARTALDGAARDAADFTALLRHGPGAEQALQDDGEALLALAAGLRELIEAHERGVIATMAGDVTAALALAHAAERVERRNLAEMS